MLRGKRDQTEEQVLFDISFVLAENASLCSQSLMRSTHTAVVVIKLNYLQAICHL